MLGATKQNYLKLKMEKKIIYYYLKRKKNKMQKYKVAGWINILKYEHIEIEATDLDAAIKEAESIYKNCLKAQLTVTEIK